MSSVCEYRIAVCVIVSFVFSTTMSHSHRLSRVSRGHPRSETPSLPAHLPWVTRHSHISSRSCESHSLPISDHISHNPITIHNHGQDCTARRLFDRCRAVGSDLSDRWRWRVRAVRVAARRIMMCSKLSQAPRRLQPRDSDAIHRRVARCVHRRVHMWHGWLCECASALPVRLPSLDGSG